MAVILVVEDDAYIREIAAMIIHDLDHDTLDASDVDGALAILRSDRQIDAVFTDIDLKKDRLGGCEVANEAVRLRHDVRVLYTTGDILTAKVTSSFVDGSDFLPKPYTSGQLEASIYHMLAA